MRHFITAKILLSSIPISIPVAIAPEKLNTASEIATTGSRQSKWNFTPARGVTCWPGRARKCSAVAPRDATVPPGPRPRGNGDVVAGCVRQLPPTDLSSGTCRSRGNVVTYFYVSFLLPPPPPFFTLSSASPSMRVPRQKERKEVFNPPRIELWESRALENLED